MNPSIKQVSNTITDFSSVPYQSTHINGGTVMGDDPNTFVVNKFCQVWGTRNLFVVGASNFPQHGGYNPTGTVGALATTPSMQLSATICSTRACWHDRQLAVASGLGTERETLIS